MRRNAGHGSWEKSSTRLTEGCGEAAADSRYYCMRETGLIGKSTFERNLYHGQAGVQQKLLGGINALLQKPAVRRLPGGLFEGPYEMTDR
jgi:hypothetical protein